MRVLIEQRPFAAILVLAAAVSSCGESSRRDDYHVNELAALPWAEEVRIGNVEDPEQGFSQIRRVRVSESGRVYVLDGSAREVRVFSPDGERLRVMGGPGEGPGEFLLPVNMGLLADTLWVNDGRARRMTWFGPDGEVLFTTPTRGVPFESGVRGLGLSLAPGHPRPDGFIESERDLFIYPDREIRSYRYPVLLFNRAGEVVDTLRWETVNETAPTFRAGGREGYAPTLGMIPPFETEMDDGKVVLDWSVPAGSDDGVMDLIRLEAESDTAYHVKLRYNTIPVPAGLLDSLVTPRLAMAPALGIGEGELESALRQAIRLPDFRPPVRSVHAGSDGGVWLQLNTASVDSADWVVIGRDGAPRGTLRLPIRTRIQHAALPTAWTVQLDEFDVPWLVRLRVGS